MTAQCHITISCKPKNPTHTLWSLDGGLLLMNYCVCCRISACLIRQSAALSSLVGHDLWAMDFEQKSLPFIGYAYWLMVTLFLNMYWSLSFTIWSDSALFWCICFLSYGATFKGFSWEFTVLKLEGSWCLEFLYKLQFSYKSHFCVWKPRLIQFWSIFYRKQLENVSSEDWNLDARGDGWETFLKHYQE